MFIVSMTYSILYFCCACSVDITFHYMFSIIHIIRMRSSMLYFGYKYS